MLPMLSYTTYLTNDEPERPADEADDHRADVDDVVFAVDNKPVVDGDGYGDVTVFMGVPSLT